MNIYTQILEAFQNKLPFVSYRKPNQNTVTTFFQNDDTLITSDNLKESGFVFAPFNDDDNSIIFPLQNSTLVHEDYVDIENFSFHVNSSNNEKIREKHILLVDQGINAIQNKLFKKVVLSRKEDMVLESFNLIETFQKLLHLYPTAFVYVWFHPKVGLWLGATPETLLSANKNEFVTMSLAGTQVFDDSKEIKWQTKEIEEQQFVTDYILNSLKNKAEQISVSKTTTVKAGSLVHLQTKIKGTFVDNLSEIVTALHPTPAVCGLPKKPAKDFILENENYNRSFYTGYLGELNLNQQTSLFVNLRCMEIKKNTATIYVGGGITAESIPEKEWLETVAKTTTMKSVL